MDNYINSPYKNIPNKLNPKFTMNNRIPILNWWFNGTSDLHKNVWNQTYLDSFLSRFTPDKIKKNKHWKEPYPKVSLMLLNAFTKYSIKNKKVAVIGSTSPWIESILLNLNNEVTTIDYNVPNSKTQIICKSYKEFENNNNLYDCIVTYSSIEHSGLGRYGDPLNPDGDIEAMQTIYKNLKNNGMLIWGAPVGHDALVWNAHRIYGKIRIPLLFDKFEEVEWISRDKEKLLNSKLNKHVKQPVIVLRKL